MGDVLAANIGVSPTCHRPLPVAHGCEIRLHGTTLYSSLVCYDDDLLVNPHVWGQPASANPLLHLRKDGGLRWFDRYASSFDAVWDTVRPWTDDAQGSRFYGGQD